MSPQSVDEMEAELALLNEAETDKIGALAAHFVALKNLVAKVDTLKKKAYNKLMDTMEEEGIDSIGTPLAKVIRQKIKSWGISEGADAEEHLANIQKARVWYNLQFPPAPIETKPTVAMLKNAWENEQANDPAAVQPTFLVEHERGQLSVRKA